MSVTPADGEHSSKTTVRIDGDLRVMTTPDSTPQLNDKNEGLEDSMLPLEGGNIYVRQDGPREAPALLLVHGAAGSTHWWDSIVPMLARSHRVIRIDLLGHGRSAKPDGGDYAIREQGRRAGLALDRLGIDHAIVIGHSTGGSVASALAEQRPGVVTALALINTGPHLDAYIAPDVPIGPAQWSHLTDEQIRQAMSSAFSRVGYQIPQQIVNDVRGMTYHAFTATLQASTDYLAQQTLPHRLAALGKPLLVIFGEDDRRWRSSSAANHRAVPGARTELLPGVGHSPMLEEPSRTVALLLAFTSRGIVIEP